MIYIYILQPRSRSKYSLWLQRKYIDYSTVRNTRIFECLPKKDRNDEQAHPIQGVYRRGNQLDVGATGTRSGTYDFSAGGL
jgi:hypothetical protein